MNTEQRAKSLVKETDQVWQVRENCNNEISELISKFEELGKQFDDYNARVESFGTYKELTEDQFKYVVRTKEDLTKKQASLEIFKNVQILKQYENNDNMEDLATRILEFYIDNRQWCLDHLTDKEFDKLSLLDETGELYCDWEDRQNERL